MPRTTKVTSIYRPHLFGALPVAGTAGSPLVKTLDEGGNSSLTRLADCWRLALSSNNEAQSVCLSMDDVLHFDVDDIKAVRVWARIPVAFSTAACKARFGLASARNADPDSIAQSLLLAINGSATESDRPKVSVESDDGVTDVAAVDTGVLLSTTAKCFEFDFATGLLQRSPPDVSLGGKSVIKLKADDANGELQHVTLPSTRLRMDGYSGGLQLFAQVQKTSSTAVGTLDILGFEVDHLVYS